MPCIIKKTNKWYLSIELATIRVWQAVSASVNEDRILARVAMPTPTTDPERLPGP